MLKILAVVYGLVCYAIFFVTFLYAIAFVGNLHIEGVVERTIDGGMPGGLFSSLVINVVLLGIFGLQHTVMARPGFKAWWTRFVPRTIERSTYVLLSSLALILLYWQWRPMPEPVWALQPGLGYDVLMGLFWAGWIIVLLSTFMIDHLGLFGIRQVMSHVRGQESPSMAFRMPAFYRIVRHPIMLGFVIAFWATPVMSQGHLLFAVVTTVYILVALHFEERDLIDEFGDVYVEYRKRVRMIVPLPKGR